MPVARPPFYSRVQRHLHTLGVLWIAWAAWNVVGWLIAMPFLTGVFGGWGWRHHGMMMGPWPFGPGFPFMHMMWLPWVISIVVFGRSILAVITGIALLRRAPWGRTLAIVAAFLTLIKPLTGTILAIYTLWVLLPGSSGQEYEQMAVQS
jgi:hypothetical protein